MVREKANSNSSGLNMSKLRAISHLMPESTLTAFKVLYTRFGCIMNRETKAARCRMRLCTTCLLSGGAHKRCEYARSSEFTARIEWSYSQRGWPRFKLRTANLRKMGENLKNFGRALSSANICNFQSLLKSEFRNYSEARVAANERPDNWRS